MRKALVTTTINVPVLLEDYCVDFIANGYKDVIIIVAGDKKTPHQETYKLCEQLYSKYDIGILYMDPKSQGDWLSKNHPEYGEFLPWNCIQRRNVAILYAYHQCKADIIYTIDDDNFLETKDYIGSHGKLGEVESLTKLYDESGWYNICDHLISERNEKFYHRGYSTQARKVKRSKRTTQNSSVKCVVNAGLWLGDPDVDAVTRMALYPNVIGCDTGGRYALGLGVNTPFNSQNTALHRDVIPAYCMSTGVGRYDDIVASYIVKRIADHLCDYISFGTPLVKQVRNEHNLWKDLEQERVGLQLIDRFVDRLYGVELKGTTYLDCAKELIEDLVNWTGFSSFNEENDFIRAICINYQHWFKAIESL